MPSCAIFSMPGDRALGVLLVVEGHDLDVVGRCRRSSTPPSSFSQAARASIERWLEMPQAAAGPEVTPTKPIFSLAFSAQAAEVAVTASARARLVVARKLRLFMFCDSLFLGQRNSSPRQVDWRTC
jgi:hypothetical protein